MQCKSCGKDFENENKVCPFCNTDNNISSNPSPLIEQNKDNETSANDILNNKIEGDNKVESPPAEVKKEVPIENDEIETLIEEPIVEKEPEVILEPVPQSVSNIVDSKEKEEPSDSLTSEPAVTTVETTNVDTPEADSDSESVEVVPATTLKEEDNNDTTQTVTNDETTPNLEEEKTTKKIDKKMILFGVIIVILVIIVVVMYLPKKDETNSENKNSNNSEIENNNSQNNNESPEQKEPKDVINSMLSYSGVYTNGMYEIILHTTNSKYVEMKINYIKDDGTSASTQASLVLNSTNYLVTEDDSFKEGIIQIEKIVDGIVVTAFSSETEGIYSLLSGTYTKETTVTNNWVGYYKNDKFDVIIDEYGDKVSLYVGNEKDSYFTTFEKNEVDKLYVQDHIIDAKTEVTVEKTVDGIQITATSSDETDIENRISGIYSKVK